MKKCLKDTNHKKKEKQEVLGDIIKVRPSCVAKTYKKGLIGIEIDLRKYEKDPYKSGLIAYNKIKF
jgi:hypothetical protein